MPRLQDLPNEMLFLVCRELDVVSLSQLAKTCKMFNGLIDSNRYEIIDDMSTHPGTPIPLSVPTYEKFKYIIDFPTILTSDPHVDVPDETIFAFQDIIDFNTLCKNQKLSTNVLRHFYRRMSIVNVLHYQKIPPDILEHVLDDVRHVLDNHGWYLVCKNQPLTLEFITKYNGHIDWHALSQNKDIMSLEILERYESRLHWVELSNLGLSEEIITRFLHKLDHSICWNHIAFTSKLSSSFVKQFHDKLPTMALLSCQQLEEETIEIIVQETTAHRPQDLWNKAACTQRLSPDFIARHKDVLHVKYLVRNKLIKRKVLQRIYG